MTPTLTPTLWRLVVTLLFAVDLVLARPEPGVLAGSVLGAEDGEALLTAVDGPVTNIASCNNDHWLLATRQERLQIFKCNKGI